MNKVQSAIVATMMTAWLTMSPPVNAQAVKTQYEVADAMNAEFLYELAQESLYTAGKIEHQACIHALRARFTELARFDTASSDQSTNPEYIKANILFEEAKTKLIASRAKIGIKWGDWNKKHLAAKK